LERVVLTDISRVLRSEERQVWQRLVRVLSHEINNSLAPIKSLTGTMTSLLDRAPRATDWETDLRKGLEVIAGRSDALNPFKASYARLARRTQPFHGGLRAPRQAAPARAGAARRGRLGAPRDPPGDPPAGTVDR